MKLKIGSFLLIALPVLATAQEISAQGFIAKFLVFSNSTLIPFLLGVAFLFFLINVIRFFVIGGDVEDERTKAKSLAIYGVLAFVIIVVFWGIINLLSGSLGFAGTDAPTPDYLEKNGTTIKVTPNQPKSNAAGGASGVDASDNPANTTSKAPINLLPPDFGGPPENGPVNCPDGSTYNTRTTSCDFQ